ncbi:glycoside-pentoside-hexuronide (GPH):cation symporter [Chakrabartyella piscis]|uniref:MFS transporter n=1 Tax=Chakrabartyella piscis TaxID=2918914 RepID=UPI002958DBF6|nr:glycoside-pentoside-hexuronide (GPH):cation symporter [Chakrabartyella piscis]
METTMETKQTTTNETVMQDQMIKVPLVTKVAYGCGDVACNISFGVISALLTLFYTDYVGITPIVIGQIMLLSRVFDGVSDVIMGYIVSHTKSKWGQSRPWILWSSIPFCLSIVLLFTVPQTTATATWIYIFVTYNFCTTVTYTALNLPYGSLSAMLTRDSAERDMVSVFRMAMSPFGRILVGMCTLPMVKLLGNTQQAFVITASIWALVALALLLFCFIKCEEKVVIPARETAAKKEKVPGQAKRSFKAVVTNQFFWIVCGLWIMQNASSGVTGILLPYYSKYILLNDTWVYSLLYFLELISLVGVVIISPKFMKKFGKRNYLMMGAAVAMAGQVLFMMNPSSLEVAIASHIIRGMGAGPLNAVIFGMLCDCVEFGQWKSGLRQEAYLFSAGSIGTKIGPGLVSALVTTLLTVGGYVSSTTGGATQPQEALDTIVRLYEWGPMIVWAVVLILGAFYSLDKLYPKVMSDLAEREARGEM